MDRAWPISPGRAASAALALGAVRSGARPKRRKGGVALSALRHIIADIWRVSWRDAVAKLELGILVLLALVAAIAARESPSAGDGAVQMYAVCYSIAPLAVVALVGRRRGDVHESAGEWSDHLSRDQIFWGRFFGYGLVGSALVGLIAAWGWFLMALVAHISWGGGALWTLIFALLALPSVVTAAGTSLWLKAMCPDPRRYYPIALTALLIVLGVEYKFSVLTAAMPHLYFFNPFPGMLQTGLVLAPAAFSQWGLNGWLCLNRTAWTIVGTLLVVAAMRRANNRYPRCHTRYVGVSMALGLALLIALGASLWGLAQKAAPRSSRTLALRTNFACAGSSVFLQVDAASGRITGQVYCAAARGGTLHFAMNAGLTLSRGPSARSSAAVAVGTAEREWTTSLAPAHPRLAWQVQGRLMPYPTLLSYPPFKANRVYSSMYAGGGQLYVAGLGSVLPSFLGPETPITVSVTGLNPRYALVSNAVFRGGSHLTATSTIGSLVVSAGPLTVRRRGPVSVWIAADGQDRLGAFLPYVGAMRNLDGWLTLPRHIVFVPSPVASHSIWRSPDLVYSDVHPYTRPRDPISGSASPPTSYTATLTLANLFWKGRPAPAVHVNSAVLTALLIFSHSNIANLDLLQQQVLGGPITQIGSLSAAVRQRTLREWRVLARLPRRQQRVWLRRAYHGVQF